MLVISDSSFWDPLTFISKLMICCCLLPTDLFGFHHGVRSNFSSHEHQIKWFKRSEYSHNRKKNIAHHFEQGMNEAASCYGDTFLYQGQGCWWYLMGRFRGYLTLITYSIKQNDLSSFHLSYSVLSPIVSKKVRRMNYHIFVGEGLCCGAGREEKSQTPAVLGHHVAAGARNCFGFGGHK